jgi:hypothetical protein
VTRGARRFGLKASLRFLGIVVAQLFSSHVLCFFPDSIALHTHPRTIVLLTLIAFSVKNPSRQGNLTEISFGFSFVSLQKPIFGEEMRRRNVYVSVACPESAWGSWLYHG